jgi:hypothetical protein
MLNDNGRDPKRVPRIGSAWTGRWTPFHIALFLSVLGIGLAGLILSSDHLISSSVSLAVNMLCLLALIVGDAWMVRRVSRRDHGKGSRT